MKTLTKYQKYLADDNEKFLTTFQPDKKHSLFNTGIEKPGEPTEKGITVFLIDDDLMYLTAMEHFLSHEIPSLKINTFKTGESSLLQVKKQHPDIVILDYFLDSEISSAENGINILKQIKHLNPGTKVVMLSGQNEINVAINSIRHGASEYVTKGEKAFIRIKDILLNAAGNIDLIGRIKKHMKVFKIINLIVFVMLVLFFLLTH